MSDFQKFLKRVIICMFLAWVIFSIPQFLIDMEYFREVSSMNNRNTVLQEDSVDYNIYKF